MGSQCSNSVSTPTTSNAIHHDYTKGTVFSQKRNHQTCIIRNQPFCNGYYIYYLTDFGHGEKGIVIYNSKSNKFGNIIPYTGKFTPSFHSYTHCNDKLYIISVNNTITVYNLTSNKSLQKNIEPIRHVSHDCGKFSTSIIVHDNIHIIGGSKNFHLHKMYDINKNIIYQPKIESHNRNKKCIHNPCVVYINKLNKLFMFGGYDGIKYVALDAFYCSSVVIDDNFIELVKHTLLDIGYPSDVMCIIIEYMLDNTNELNVVWTENKSATLPISLSRCGYILYDKFLFTFGGYTNHEYIAKIYCLNIFNMDNGWKLLDNIQCPIAACYHAVLVQNKAVHLFTRSNNVETPQHFAVSMQVLLLNKGIFS
eukprot:100166_1